MRLIMAGSVEGLRREIATIEKQANIADLSVLRDQFIRATINPYFTELGLQTAKELPRFYEANREMYWSRFEEEIQKAGFETFAEFQKRSQEVDPFLAMYGLFPFERDEKAPKSQFDIDSTSLDIYLTEKLNAPVLERRAFVNAIDRKFQAMSAEALTEIRRLKAEGKTLKLDTVIVGDGPIASSIAALLGPTAEVTILTDQIAPGDVWRKRGFFHINSSAKRKVSQGKELPLQDGPTTRVLPSGFAGGVRLEELAANNDNVLEVQCDDGEIRRYLSGELIGDSLKANFAPNISKVIAESEFIPEKTFVNERGKVILTFTNEGEEFQVEAKRAYIATGPGKDETKIDDAQSKTEYQESKDFMKEQLKRARARLAAGEEPSKVLIYLPRIIPFSVIEDLYLYWIRDCNSDDTPGAYPFEELFESVDIGIVGKKDSAKVFAEFAKLKRGPKNAYPKGFAKRPYVEAPLVTIYGAKINAEDENSRRRYKGYTQGTDDLDALGVEGLVVSQRINKRGILRGVETIIQKNNGETERRRDDFVIVCTGLESERVADRLGTIMLDAFDTFGNRVGKESVLGEIQILGSANKFAKRDFPESIQKILDSIGVGENTVALWVWQLLAERQAYTNRFRMGKEGLNGEKMDALYEAIYGRKPQRTIPIPDLNSRLRRDNSFSDRESRSRLTLRDIIFESTNEDIIPQSTRRFQFNEFSENSSAIKPFNYIEDRTISESNLDSKSDGLIERLFSQEEIKIGLKEIRESLKRIEERRRKS